MHHRLYCVLDKDAAKNSEEARELAYSKFHDHVIDEPNYDWGLVGGRWSGTFTIWHLDQEKYKALNEEFEKEYGWWTNSEFSVEDRAAQYLPLQQKYFPDYKGDI
ncbi:MAG: hypothetical protein WC375_12750, partial [Methanomassiliicoccales archaeon]